MWNLSAYEKERLRNMTSNKAHLASLGLVPLVLKTPACPGKRTPRPAAPRHTRTRSVPMRLRKAPDRLKPAPRRAPVCHSAGLLPALAGALFTRARDVQTGLPGESEWHGSRLAQQRFCLFVFHVHAHAHVHAHVVHVHV